MEIKDVLKRKDIFIIIIMFVVTLMVSTNIFKKQMIKANSLKEAISEQEKINGILGEIKTIEKKSNELKKKFPRQEANSLINKISELAQGTGVNIISIQPGQEKEAKEDTPYKEIPFVLTLEANYHEMGKFLSKLETADIFFKINRLEFVQESGQKILSRKSIKMPARLVIITIIIKT